MMSSGLSNFSSETLFFLENFNLCTDNFLINDYNYLFFLSDYTNYTNLKFFNNSNLHTQSLITLINQIDDIDMYSNLENVTSIYHY
jgi:hypothetical protein